MILISGSSEREIVDLQQGDYEEMDQLAIAKPRRQGRLPRAARRGHRRRHRARHPRRGVGPPGRRLPRPAGQALRADRSTPRRAGRSLIKVVDPAPKQIPAPDAVQARARSAQEREEAADHSRQGRGLRAGRCRHQARWSRRPASRTCRCRWPRASLPDTHEQCASAARSFVLPGADVVMLIGARLNWLLSHGKGKTWGGKGAQGLGRPEVHPDRHLAAGGRQQRPHRRAGRRRHRLVRVRAARRTIGRQLGEAAGRVADARSPRRRQATSPRWRRRWRRTRRR